MKPNLDDIRWIRFQDNLDSRGRLTAIESQVDIPFQIARVFLVHQVTSVERGGHAHIDTDQVASAAHGSLRLEISDGSVSRTYELNRPDRGVYIPRLTFVRLSHFSPDAVCLVLANTIYDRSRSLRTWEEYIDYLQVSRV